MQSDLSPAEYRQSIDAELGMDEFAAGMSRAVNGYCCDAGRVCAPDPCPWHQMGDSDAT